MRGEGELKGWGGEELCVCVDRTDLVGGTTLLFLYGV